MTDTLSAAGFDSATQTTQLSNGLTCELPADSPLAKLLRSNRTWVGPTAKERLKILRAAKTVAIVGASPNPARSSYFVATYLQQSSDYELYFVNPNADEILGRPVYKSLADLPVVPDIVDVFRKASDIQSVIDDVVAIGDSANDIEMIAIAGLGIAMGNADGAVKAVADEVTASVADDGVWQWQLLRLQLRLEAFEQA